jgi:uncharacterized membrane protein
MQALQTQSQPLLCEHLPYKPSLKKKKKKKKKKKNRVGNKTFNNKRLLVWFLYMLKFTSSLETAIVVEALGAGLWGAVGGDVENLVVRKLVPCGGVVTHLTNKSN